MGYRALLFVALTVIVFTVFSQLRQTNADYNKLYADAETLYNSETSTPATDSVALAKYQTVIKYLAGTQLNDSLLFDSYVKCGFILTSFKNDRTAIKQFASAVTLNSRSIRLHDSLSFIPWLFMGNGYYNLYNPDSALLCYKQAESLLATYPHLNDAERLYNKIGVLYYEAGDYKRSIPYFIKALSLLDTSGTGNTLFVVNYKNNIASAYRKLQQFDKALAIYNSLLAYGYYHNELLHNIGATYLEKGDAASAVRYLQQAAYNSAARFNDLALAYVTLSNADVAMASINSAMQSYTTPALLHGPDYANTCKLAGDAALLKQQFLPAVAWYQKAIIAASNGFTDTLPTSNPAVFNGLNHFYFLFDALAAKAKAYTALYRQNGQNDNLVHAFDAYKSALELSVFTEKVYGTDDAKFFLKKKVEPVYRAAVETGLAIYQQTKDTAYLAKVFAFVEGSKASILQANVADIELADTKGMPVDLISEEKSLKAHLAGFDMQIAEAGDSIQVAILQQQARDVAIELSGVQQQLDGNNNYSRLKYAPASVSPRKIQEEVLPANTAVISYYVSDSSLLCFYVTKTRFGYVRSTPVTTLPAEINELNSQLKAGDGGDAGKIKQLCAELYKQLIAPISAEINDVEHLIIIPHSAISYVPFEILTPGNNEDMLVNHYAVGYQYSANFLNTTTSHTDSYSVLAMAPFATYGSPQDGLPALTASGKEVEALPGKSLMDGGATKAAFLQLAAGYPVLHLATHATVNDTTPLGSYISFYGAGSRLYEPEIYQLNLAKTRLAILSACETGSGQLVNSEGLISLSRAFSYAGCKSVVTSLWKANDVATSFICKRLHYYLKKGAAIDEALQHAKKDYLASDEIEQRYKKPAYWANLILIGDAHAITGTDHLWWWFFAGFIMIALLILIKKKAATFSKVKARL